MRFILPRGGGLPEGLLQGAVAAAGEGRAVRLAMDTRDCCQRGREKREGVVVIMGATGTGKSKLAIDVAGRFPAEVVNADKIQVYRGLDVTTNKMPIAERCGVPHHLLGDLDPAAGELQPEGFRSLAETAVAGIFSRGRLPLLVGGSNSFIHAMMINGYDRRSDPFSGPPPGHHQPRYRPCFLWVDVETTVLAQHLDRRVEEMVGLGMVEELERYFSGKEADKHPGLRKAIGVPEFREYFRRRTTATYREAIETIKKNTRWLALEQVRKIKCLREMGWPLHRVDATEMVATRLAGDGRAAVAGAWERDVLSPSLIAVERFL